MTALSTLHAIRAFAGPRQTIGLPDEVVERFAASDPTLGRAIEQAWAAHRAAREELGELLAGDETDAVAALQAAIVNFYPQETVNSYVALAGAGPWLVTTHGAVLHDNGGYGMLGLGHGPGAVIEAMAGDRVMANVMTPSLSHKRFTDRLRREIGQTRGGCPFPKFICMNSGSEAVTVAFRIADVLAARRTAPGGDQEGAEVRILALEGGFHGRTDRPAQASDSCLATYKRHLRTHRDNDNLVTVPPNDVAALRAAFADAEREGAFFELMLVEPVMGEGDPGLGCTRAFYDAACALTKAHGTLLLIDSIQAGIRGSGYLSLVDYPGFEDAEAPDMETWSKALNAGQYPLSVLGLNQRAAELYVRGIYGNTMTSNPRALEVGCAVLDGLTPELRENIRRRGREFLDALRGLVAEFPGVVTRVQGTGLLFSAELEGVPVVGFEGLETWLRKHGLGVIHGGENSLRFTPHFAVTEAEVDLIVDLVRQGVRHFVGPALGAPSPVAEARV